MSIIVGNNSYSTLGASIGSGATTLSVQPGHGARFPVIAAPDVGYITIENSGGSREIVKVTDHPSSSDSFTVVRGQDGTAAAAWVAGDIVEMRVCRAVLDMLKVEQAVVASNAKATPVDGDLLPLIDSEAANALKKLSIANLKTLLNTLYRLVTGDVTVQAGGKIIFEGATDDAFELTLDPGDPTADTTLELLKCIESNKTKTLTAGYSVDPFDAGTKTTGTFTPDPANGNQQYCVNGGAFTLAPPATATSMILEILNNGTAGAITTSGFTKVVGSFTTTNAHKFACMILKTKNYSLLQIQALQ